jgi:nucleotide-binding universal stress UspA family protein
MLTKILVAVSANSTDTVLESAVEIARKYDARIVALHVVDPTPCFLGPYDSDFGLIVEAMEGHGRDTVKRITKLLDQHAHPVETRMVTLPMSGSTIGCAIADVAEESGADLILLGERQSGFWRYVREDVAANVRRHSGTPIQIVRGKSTGSVPRRASARWTDATVTGTR